jgi:GNAT superfamily N-acetyltransferase
MPYTTVRRVLVHEYPKYSTHLKALDAESRYLRFGAPVQDEIIQQLCAGFAANYDQHILFAVENNDLEFIAVGHVSLQDGMELAFSVLPQYQGHGLGNLLIKRIISWCRTHGELHGTMVCLSTNTVIQHLCAKHGIHVKSSQGETIANIELDSPNITTYLAEAADSNLAIMDYMGKRMLRRSN